MMDGQVDRRMLCGCGTSSLGPLTVCASSVSDTCPDGPSLVVGGIAKGLLTGSPFLYLRSYLLKNKKAGPEQTPGLEAASPAAPPGAGGPRAGFFLHEWL